MPPGAAPRPARGASVVTRRSGRDERGRRDRRRVRLRLEGGRRLGLGRNARRAAVAPRPPARHRAAADRIRRVLASRRAARRAGRRGRQPERNAALRTSRDARPLHDRALREGAPRRVVSSNHLGRDDSRRRHAGPCTRRGPRGDPRIRPTRASGRSEPGASGPTGAGSRKGHGAKSTSRRGTSTSPGAATSSSSSPTPNAGSRTLHAF